MSEARREKQNAALTASEAEGDNEDEEHENAAQQCEQTDQIIRTGAITATKGRHVIHCLTIIGHIVTIDSLRAFAF